MRQQQQQRRCRRAAVAAAPRAQQRGDSSSSSSSSSAPTAAPGPATPAAAPTTRAAAPTTRGPPAFNDSVPEQVFFEGSASNAELAIALLLAATLVYIPITIQVVAKRAWFTFVFTNKRLTIVNRSPLFASTTEVAYKQIREVRSAPRAFNLWGDVVVFLKNGDRVELTGVERHAEIRRHIMSCILDDA